MSRILSISLPPELTRAIRKQAKYERRTVSEVAREALKRYLETAGKPANAGGAR